MGDSMRKPNLLVSIITLSLIAISLSSFSSLKLNTVATPTPPVTLTPTPIVQNDNEVDLLKVEIELLKNHNQQILETIYWSIGAVFTLALFVVGAGWYVNFRLYDRDKIEIKRSLEESFKERFEQDRLSLQSLAQKSGETAAANLNAQFANMKRDMLSLQFNMLEEEAISWRGKEVNANELSTYFRMLEIARQLYAPGWEWKLSKALEGMQNALKSGAKPDVEEVREITSLVSGAKLGIGYEQAG